MDLSSEVPRLEHQQPASVRPRDHPLLRHPGVAQEVDGLHLRRGALLQGSVRVAQQLQHPAAADAYLRVVVRAEADLTSRENTNHGVRARAPARRAPAGEGGRGAAPGHSPG